MFGAYVIAEVATAGRDESGLPSDKGRDEPSWIDRAAENPWAHFVVSEILAGLAGIVVYAVVRACASLVPRIDDVFPVKDPAPEALFEQVLHWGGVFSASATILIITLYQIAILVKRLHENYKK